MVKVAPRTVARFIADPPSSAAVVLLYGADRGQVAELAQAVVEAVAEDPHDPFRVADLTLASIQEDPARLGDEALAMSLTGLSGRSVTGFGDRAGGGRVAGSLLPAQTGGEARPRRRNRLLP